MKVVDLSLEDLAARAARLPDGRTGAIVGITGPPVAGEDAERWVAGSEDRNTDLVEARRTRADLVLRVVP